MRYSVLRLLILFGFLCALWLLGLRGFWLILLTGVLSMALSFFVLRGPRADLSRKVAAHIDARVARADQHRSFEDEEDDEDEQYGGAPGSR